MFYLEKILRRINPTIIHHESDATVFFFSISIAFYFLLIIANVGADSIFNQRLLHIYVHYAAVLIIAK